MEQLSEAIEALLPEEVQAMLLEKQEQRNNRLDAFSLVVSKKRDEAITAREASGIEDTWIEDEESYEGIDDANRDTNRLVKGTNPNGGVYSRVIRSDGRSTVFLNITRPYVDSASARVADMLLPTDDRNWGIKPTPIPELLDAKGDATPVPMMGGQPMIGGQQQSMGMQPPMMGGGMPGIPMTTVGDLAKQQIELAEERAKNAEKRIDDWMVQSQYHAEVRKVIEDSARIGVGILKGPHPYKRRSIVSQGQQNAIEMVVKEDINPGSFRVDPWNLYPDPACGDNIHNGGYCIERDTLTSRQLKDLIGIPGYLKEQIEKCLEEGPGKKYQNDPQLRSKDKSELSEKDLFEVWYFYGDIGKDDYEAAGGDVDKAGKADDVHAIVTVVNDRVIKATLNPLDSGEFPYDVMPWQARAGSWAGIGVARQVRTPQRMLNAATRNMMDNAGLSAGPQIVIRRNVVEPADGNWTLSPRKFWYAKEDADARTVADAFLAINIPTMQQELMNIIQFAQKMAEDTTGLPMLLQGQQGSAPETVGGMQMLFNNASAVLRRIARTFDDNITEPHVRRYYEWLMMYGENPEEKGDFVIDARGSTALVERDLQNQAILQMAQLVMNPAFGVDPKKWFSESCKAQRLDPKRFQYSEEEMAKLQQQPPQPPPQIAVAQINAQSREKIAQIGAMVEREAIQKRDNMEAVYAQTEQQIAAQNAQARNAELALRRELAMLDYANKHQMKLEEVKAKLADTAMRLNVQKELASLDTQIDLHKHHNPSPTMQPPVQVPGRAPDGRAFEQV